MMLGQTQGYDGRRMSKLKKPIQLLEVRVNLYLSTSLVQKETTKNLSEMCETCLDCATKVLRSLLLSFVYSIGTDAEGFV